VSLQPTGWGFPCVVTGDGHITEEDNMTQQQRTYSSTHYSGKNSGLSLTLENGIRLSIIWGRGAMCTGDSVEVMPFVAEGYCPPINGGRKSDWLIIPGYTRGYGDGDTASVMFYVPVRDIPALIEAALTLQPRPIAAKHAALPVELL
jgi:hypothetical protein